MHVTIEGTADGSTWAELVAEQIPADDTTLLFRWEPVTLVGVRMVLAPGSVEPQGGVMYVGKLLVFERGVQAHMPITYGRQRNWRSVGWMKWCSCWTLLKKMSTFRQPLQTPV